MEISEVYIIIDDIQEDFGELSISEQMVLADMLLAGETKQACMDYLKPNNQS